MSAIQFINIAPEKFMKDLSKLIDEKVKQHLNLSSNHELLTHEEAAEFLRVHPDNLRRYKKTYITCS